MEDLEFTPNPDLMDQLHMFDPVQASIKQTAEAIAARVKQDAPVDSGAFAESIEVNRANNKGGVWRVASDDYAAPFIEFGTHSQPARFIFRNAVTSLGLSFTKGKGK
jgi:HK97 gp10 family phage protein